MNSHKRNERLPGEFVLPLRSADVVRLILATVVLVLLFNLLALWYSRTFSANAGYWLVREKWRLLMKIDEPVEWLILGDSSANQGIVPDVWNTALQTTSINLATLGNMPVLGDLLMLETYIQRIGPPRNVLILRVYDTWNRKMEPNVIALLPAKLGTRLLWNPKNNCNIQCKLLYLLIRYVPLYSENITLSRLLRNPSDLFQPPLRMIPGGYVPEFEPDPNRVIADAESHIEWYSDQKFTLSEMNRYSLEKIRDLSERYHFNVYLSSSPLYEGLYQDARFQSYYNQVWHRLASICKDGSRMYVLSQPITFSKNEMTSADHVIDSAAHRFTRKLADSIQLMERTSRW